MFYALIDIYLKFSMDLVHIQTAIFLCLQKSRLIVLNSLLLKFRLSYCSLSPKKCIYYLWATLCYEKFMIINVIYTFNRTKKTHVLHLQILHETLALEIQRLVQNHLQVQKFNVMGATLNEYLINFNTNINMNMNINE